MSQFNYFNEIATALRMDGEMARGTLSGLQKQATTSTPNRSLNKSSRTILSTSYTNCTGVSSQAKTIRGNSSGAAIGKALRSPTPTKKFESPEVSGDRFIPNRSSTNFDLAHYLIKQEQNKTTKEEENDSPHANQREALIKEERQKLISDAMQIGDTKRPRILVYDKKPPATPDSHLLKVVYSSTPKSAKSGPRQIPQTSKRILEAPNIIDNFYLNLLDWSADNIVTLALGDSVYLWNADTGDIKQLVEYQEGDQAGALAWIQEGQVLAIGRNAGTVELWDCQREKRIRVMDGHTARVGSLAWNEHVVTSGSHDASIVHHDVRAREHNIVTLVAHTHEVCGLKWSGDGRYLASGGNDNLINVWSRVNDSSGSGSGAEPLYVFNQHQAAVRALAWSPWQPHLLASGGGTADRCIKFWNVDNGVLLNSVDSKSSVSALLWSREYKELISAHGHSDNQLIVWKYPSMVKQAELMGHTARVLQMAMSPDGSSVLSASADETLRLWNCFEPDPHRAKKASSLGQAEYGHFRRRLR